MLESLSAQVAEIPASYKQSLLGSVLITIEGRLLTPLQPVNLVTLLPETSHSDFQIIKPDQIASGIFGLIHRSIGRFNNIVCTGRMVEKQYNADT